MWHEDALSAEPFGDLSGGCSAYSASHFWSAGSQAWTSGSQAWTSMGRACRGCKSTSVFFERRSRRCKAFETIGQRAAAIELGKLTGVDELVTEPGKLLRVETFDPPVDQVADPGNAPGIGVITHAAPVLPVNARPTAPSISF